MPLERGYSRIRLLLIDSNPVGRFPSAYLPGSPSSPWAGRDQWRVEVERAMNHEEAVLLLEQWRAEGSACHLAWVESEASQGQDVVDLLNRLWDVDGELGILLRTNHSQMILAEVSQRPGWQRKVVVLEEPANPREGFLAVQLLAANRLLDRVLGERPMESRQHLEGQATHPMQGLSEVGQEASVPPAADTGLMDPRTRLPARGLFLDRVRQALATAQRHQGEWIIALLSLDDFHAATDGAGYPLGDELLAEIGKRLSAGVRKSDTAAHMESGEFALLLRGSQNNRGLLDRLSSDVARPVWIQGKPMQFTCSIGCSLFPEDGDELESLLRMAGAALGRAKESGGACVRFFDPKIQRQAEERKGIEDGLRNALDGTGLSLNYQPQVELSSGRIIGVEALLRWEHPVLGQIPPRPIYPRG